jgi:hypothetical protein
VRNALLTLLLTVLVAGANPAGFYAGLMGARLRLATSTPSVPWTPADYTNTGLIWLDFSDSTRRTVVSNKVTYITDKGTTSRNLTNGVIATAPWVVSNAANGLDALGFLAASNTVMTLTPNSIAVDVGGAGSYFSAHSRTSNAVLVVWGQITTFAAHSYFAATGEPSLQSYRRFQLFTPFVASGAHIDSVTSTGTMASVSWRVDGTALSTSGSGLSVPAATILTQLGRWNTASSSGWIGETIVTSEKVSDANRDRFEGYLAHKWGTAGLLPADHPYKSAAPTK